MLFFVKTRNICNAYRLINVVIVVAVVVWTSHAVRWPKQWQIK